MSFERRPVLATARLFAAETAGAGGPAADDARVWRESRRDACAATRKQKTANRETWRAWPGPATVRSYRYIVDLHTGALDLRRRAASARTRI